MGFPVSPGVAIQEIDLTTVISQATQTIGALAGVFSWGPLYTPVTVDSENPALITRFGKPSNLNAETWFTAANFLAYASNLLITRAGVVTGNTIEKSFTANATTNAATQNSNILYVGNTTGLNPNMQLFFINNNSVFLDPNTTISSIINSSSVHLSETAQINATSLDVIFRDFGVYSAVAQEVTEEGINWYAHIVANNDVYANAALNFDASVNYIARFPGSYGNSLRVAVCDSADQFESNVNLVPNNQINASATFIVANVGSNVVTVTITPTSTASVPNVTAANVVAGVAQAEMSNGDLIEVGNVSIGFQILKVTAISNVINTSNVFSFNLNVALPYRLGINDVSNTIERFWEFHNDVGQIAPGQSPWMTAFGNTSANDELHVVVVDDGGKFTGVSGSPLEIYVNLSRATDSKAPDGGTNYYANVINQDSQYIWWAADRTLAPSNTGPFLISSEALDPYDETMYGGNDGHDESEIDMGSLFNAYDTFKSAEDHNVSLIMQGKARGSVIGANTDLGNYIIQNICEIRKDCICLVSPAKEIVVGNYGFQVDDMINAENLMPPSSYGTMDSGYKYQYDRYNDLYRWIPLNGDCAGLAARTDLTNDPWWSYAGLNRGQIKNSIRLAFNPKQTDRDNLYVGGVNPVVTFKGEGTVLFGNKTLLNTTSAFSRVNVRRLFITLEKAISTAARQLLFEFNDDFTRAQFKAMVVPYLQTIKGRRGIYDYLVVCDATNNTPDIIDNNQFIGDIYIKPARTIEFMLLRFIAVSTGVAFNEVVGTF
jgi:hypothetical protein